MVADSGKARSIRYLAKTDFPHPGPAETSNGPDSCFNHSWNQPCSRNHTHVSCIRLLCDPCAIHMWNPRCSWWDIITEDTLFTCQIAYSWLGLASSPAASVQCRSALLQFLRGLPSLHRLTFLLGGIIHSKSFAQAAAAIAAYPCYSSFL